MCITQQGESQGKRENSPGCCIISLTRLELFTQIFISHEWSMTQFLCAARDMRAGASLVERSLPHRQSHSSALPQSDVVLLIDFAILTCWLLSTQWPLKAGHHAPATLLQLSKTSLLFLILHHSGSTQLLTLDFASHWPTWRQQLLVFKGSTCVYVLVLNFPAP